MTRLLYIALGLFLGWIVFGASLANAAPNLPAPSLRVYELPQAKEAEPTAQPVRPLPAINPSTVVGLLGLTNQVECWNCAPFEQQIKVSHYNPMAGPINCWDYDPKNSYCYSPTQPGIRWKGLWGLGAACPVDWPFGTWVVIPQVGAFICLDRGGSIVCDPETKICNVDILGPTGPWDGTIVKATLWVPLDPPRN